MKRIYLLIGLSIFQLFSYNNCTKTTFDPYDPEAVLRQKNFDAARSAMDVEPSLGEPNGTPPVPSDPGGGGGTVPNPGGGGGGNSDPQNPSPGEPNTEIPITRECSDDVTRSKGTALLYARETDVLTISVSRVDCAASYNNYYYAYLSGSSVQPAEIIYNQTLTGAPLLEFVQRVVTAKAMSLPITLDPELCYDFSLKLGNAELVTNFQFIKINPYPQSVRMSKSAQVLVGRNSITKKQNLPFPQPQQDQCDNNHSPLFVNLTQRQFGLSDPKNTF